MNASYSYCFRKLKMFYTYFKILYAFVIFIRVGGFVVVFLIILILHSFGNFLESFPTTNAWNIFTVIIKRRILEFLYCYFFAIGTLAQGKKTARLKKVIKAIFLQALYVNLYLHIENVIRLSYIYEITIKVSNAQAICLIYT